MRIKISSYFIPSILFVLIIWITFFADNYFELNLWRYGLYPRTIKGLLGIFTMPFIHGDLLHIINNTIPLIILITFLFYFYTKFFTTVIIALWLSSGLWTWVIARPSYHIGASALIYGLAAFIFFAGLIIKEKRHAAISFIIVFLYGGIIWGIFPIQIEHSWEGHLTGFLSGTILAYFFRKNLREAYVTTVSSNDDENEEEDDDSDDENAYWKSPNFTA